MAGGPPWALTRAHALPAVRLDLVTVQELPAEAQVVMARALYEYVKSSRTLQTHWSWCRG